MEFEFDPKKSNTNKEKHGIDFYEAQALWNDPDLIEIPVKTSDEPRFLVVGNISGKYSVRRYYLSVRKDKNYFGATIQKRGG